MARQQAAPATVVCWYWVQGLLQLGGTKASGGSQFAAATDLVTQGCYHEEGFWSNCSWDFRETVPIQRSPLSPNLRPAKVDTIEKTETQNPQTDKQKKYACILFIYIYVCIYI